MVAASSEGGESSSQPMASSTLTPFDAGNPDAFFLVEETILANTVATDVRVSPLGTYVAYASGGQVFIKSLQSGGAPEPLGGSAAEPATQPDVNDNGQTVFMQRKTGIQQIFFRARNAQSAYLVSRAVTAPGASGNADSRTPRFGPNGEIIFISKATNLISPSTTTGVERLYGFISAPDNEFNRPIAVGSTTVVTGTGPDLAVTRQTGSTPASVLFLGLAEELDAGMGTEILVQNSGGAAWLPRALTSNSGGAGGIGLLRAIVASDNYVAVSALEPNDSVNVWLGLRQANGGLGQLRVVTSGTEANNIVGGVSLRGDVVFRSGTVGSAFVIRPNGSTKDLRFGRTGVGVPHIVADGCFMVASSDQGIFGVRVRGNGCP